MLVHVVADYGPAGDLVFAEVTRRANEGERFTAAQALNGTLVVGPNSGHSLAFLHDQAPLFLDVPAAGSQVR